MPAAPDAGRIVDGMLRPTSWPDAGWRASWRNWMLGMGSLIDRNNVSKISGHENLHGEG